MGVRATLEAVTLTAAVSTASAAGAVIAGLLAMAADHATEVIAVATQITALS